MADKKISALTAASTPLAGTEVLPIVQGGSTVKVAVSSLTAGRAVSTGSQTIVSAGPISATINNGLDGTAAIYQKFFSTGGNYFIGVDRSTGGSLLTGAAYALCFTTESARPLYFGTNNTTRMIIDATSGNVTVSTGNVIIGTAGKGIDFSANANAPGMTSELLTWYEEGTWTPVVVPSSGAITTQTCSGRYTRIGRLVIVQLSIFINDVGTAGSISSISGLPFTSANTTDVGSGSLREYNSTGFEWNFTVNPNATTIFAAQYNNSTAINTNYAWRGSLSYFV